MQIDFYPNDKFLTAVQCIVKLITSQRILILNSYQKLNYCMYILLLDQSFVQELFSNVGSSSVTVVCLQDEGGIMESTPLSMIPR